MPPKTKTVAFAIPALLLTAAAIIAGPLNPPAGPPTSTYKTLTEVEPRIAINATNTPGDADSLFRITAPGSYYLTGNITGVATKSGIEIASGDVTIDLCGFEVLGVSGSLDGINTSIADLRNVTILNGSVRAWGQDGIDLVTFSAIAGRLSGVTSADNTAVGIRSGRGYVMSHCTASFNGTDGIATASGTAISHCTSFSNTGVGFTLNFGSHIASCAARLNGTDGILASGGNIITSNMCDSNGQAVAGGAGIHVIGADNRIEDNNISSTDRGIETSTSGNFVVRNTCSGNATNWVLAANTIYGPILDRTAPAAAAVNGSTGPGSLGTTDPNANFTY